MNPLRRKLILSTWRSPTEGNIYGKLTVDAKNALSYLAFRSQVTGQKHTMTHFVGRAIGQAIKETPDINGFIRFGKFVPHKEVAVSFLVALEDGKNLGQVKLSDVDQMQIQDVSKALMTKANQQRTGQDTDLKQSLAAIRLLPKILVRPTLWLTGFITSSLGWSISLFGLKKFPFGSCMITSVGMFGLDEGWAPQTPFARTPLVVLIGAVRDKPVVMNDSIVVRPLLTITATIDHRFIDGAQGANLAKAVRAAFDKPWTMDGFSEDPRGRDHVSE